MSVSQLSVSTQNYLKVIWGLGEWDENPVSTKRVARKMGVTLSSVSDAIKKLRELGLVDHAPYGSITLTDEGYRLALAMVRRHRLVELFLVNTLGYGWDEVHDEAENLEHAVSDLMIDRIDVLLGSPRRDPHGDPIPAPDGSIIRPSAVRLDRAPAGAAAVVERISDSDPALLQQLAESGILLDSRVSLGEKDALSETIAVSVENSMDSVQLGVAASKSIWVSLPSQ